MKKIYSPLFKITLICAVAFTTACGSGSKKDGSDDKTASAESAVKKFSNADGKFMIQFPAEPKVSDQKVPTAAGDIEMHMFVYEKSATEAYQVIYSDYPSEIIKATNIDTLLKNSKNGCVNELKAKITEEKKIDMNGNPGVWFRANSDQFYVTYKLFLVGNRLYQIGMLRDGSHVTDDAVKGFMDTFELVKS
jgi:hypothetical protein